MIHIQVASPVPDWRGQTTNPLGAGPSRVKLPPPGLAAPPGFQNSSAAQHLPPNNLGRALCHNDPQLNLTCRAVNFKQIERNLLLKLYNKFGILLQEALTRAATEAL